jgi:NACHT domain
VVLWALFVLPWVVALVLVRRHHHLDVGGWTLALTVSLGLPTLWVTWATFRDSRRSGGGLSMAQVADELAAAVGKQWSKEAAVRRLNDPYPLPVPWTAANASLTDSWDSLAELAASGAGWPTPTSGQAWAAGPEDLAGEGSALAETLGRVPTGRLVVLGEPGAGKTMLMVRLVLDLLARRAGGGPVPVLVSVASWDPSGQDLRDWLSTQLIINYPALAVPPPAAVTESTRAAALLAAGLILPVLDGLDEIPGQVRGPAISRINDALQPGGQVVVTCRTQQYQDAVRPPDGIEVTLRGAAAIQLRPLGADAVRRYLSDAAAGPVTRARWNPVLAVLGTHAPAGQALSTPLMIGLARAIYYPRPGELAGTMRDPAELCGFADRAAVEAHLFDEFIPAAYRSFTGSRWTATQAEKWLKFLARHLEYAVRVPDLAWWQLNIAVPGTTFWLVFALAAGLAAWIAAGIAGGLVFGLVAGLGGLAAGLAGGHWLGRIASGLMFVSGSGPDLPARGMRIQVNGIVLGLVFGLVFGLTFGLAGGLAGGLAVGLVFGLMEGGVASDDLTGATSPGAVLARDRQVALLLMFSCVLGLALAAGYQAEITSRLAGALAAVFVISAALGYVLTSSMTKTAWPSYVITRGWLVLHHQLPWSLMSFLADAHQRGVLRQVGATYQFRHIDLQHRLATRP